MELLHLLLKGLKFSKVFLLLLAALGMTLFLLWFFYVYAQEATADIKKKWRHS